MAYYGNHGARRGRKPHWLEVAFWVVLLGGATVAVALMVPTDLAGRIFLVSVTIAGWAWVFSWRFRKRRRESRRAPDDQLRWDAPPPEIDR